MPRPIRQGEMPTMTPLERINSLKMPFAELKGVAFTEAGKDRVVARMLVRPDLCTLGHTIHGGALMAFADSVGGAATVIAIATPVHRGRRTQVWQTRLETEDGKLVALVTQTQMVL